MTSAVLLSMLAMITPVAQHHWPASSCVTSVPHVVPSLFIDGQYRGGLAHPQTCEFDIALDAVDHNPREICRMVVHELGHNAGQPHSSAPDSIMNPDFPETAVAAECDGFPHLGAQEAAVQAGIGLDWRRMTTCAVSQWTASCVSRFARGRRTKKTYVYIMPNGEYRSQRRTP